MNLEGEHYCEDCWGRDAYWPCDASRLLAALSAYEDKFNAMDDDVARAFAQRDAAQAALSEAEAARDHAENQYTEVVALGAEMRERLEALEGALQETAECLEDAMHSDYDAAGGTTFEHWKGVRNRAFALDQEHTEPRAATSYFHGTPFGQLPADPPEREWNDRGERGDQGL